MHILVFRMKKREWVHIQYSQLTNWGVVIIMFNNEGIFAWAKMFFKRLAVCRSLIGCGNGAKPPKSVLIKIVSYFLLYEVTPEHPKCSFKRKLNRHESEKGMNCQKATKY